MAGRAMGLWIGARETRFLLPGDSGRLLRLSLEGYRQRLHRLLQSSLEDRLPVFLGGRWPVDEEAVALLERLAGSGLTLLADRDFRHHFQACCPESDLMLRQASLPPAGASVLTPIELFQEPAWRVLSELAIPLPRRLVLAVDEPWPRNPAHRARQAEAFSHFLDTGGVHWQMSATRVIPLDCTLAWELLQLFPQARVYSAPGAAVSALIRQWRALPEALPGRWIFIHAGHETTTVLALERDRVLAGIAHRTEALGLPKMADYLTQLAAGCQLGEEVVLDGGLFADTRILPGDRGPWLRVVTGGPAGDRFGPLAAGEAVPPPESGDWEEEGLRQMLALSTAAPPE